MSAEAARFVEGSVQIGSLPGLLFQLRQALDDPNISAADFARLIGADAALTARLLKIVHCSQVGTRTPVESLTLAVTQVGREEIAELVRTATVIRYFRGMAAEQVNMESFWRHSIACATAARTVAVYAMEPDGGRYYIAGLLHDVGRLALFMNHYAAMGRVFEQYRRGGLLLAAERDVLDSDHAEVGGALLEKWGLPEPLVAAVRHHHSPEAAGPWARAAAIVHVADMLVHAMQWGESGERFVPPLSPGAWDLLGLSPAVLPELLSRLEGQVREAVQPFGEVN